ncbi:glycosyltransferase family 39 protein [Massilia sp. W12]|uniref:glycosyltransferase family 39 protein n=1 Tax=Massilia sp. W12 TaxID=3126507 RepID=UPI0030D10611
MHLQQITPHSAQAPHTPRHWLWALLIVFTVAWFAMLDARTLAPTDEGRYAEMAREMLVTGDWVTPRLNGIKYFYKPPLQTWMNAATFAAFGLGEWQARFWTGLCGYAGILLTFLAGARVYGQRTGLIAAAILAACFWWAGMGHINTLDMGLSGLMTLSLMALLIAQREGASERERMRYMLLCWAGMAGATMSKGLIGIVLPGAVLVLYTLITRDWALWGRLYLGRGLLLFFALCAPWFILVSLRNPEFPHYFFIHEHFERFLTKVHQRYGPWYYFIPLLIIGLLPWLALLPAALRAGFKRDPGRFQPRLMLLIWGVFIFFFFSYSSSKLPSYILPIFPALALLLALAAQEAKRSHLLAMAGLPLLLALIGMPFISRIPELNKIPAEAAIYAAFVPWTWAALICLGAGALLAMLWLLKDSPRMRERAVLVLAVAGFAWGQLMVQGSEAGGRHRAGMEIIPAMQAQLRPEMKLYAFGLYEQCIPFYLRRTMVQVEHKDELAFGLSQEPHLWIPHREAFFKIWREGPPAMMLARPDVARALKEQGLPLWTVAADTRRVALMNRPLPGKE